MQDCLSDYRSKLSSCGNLAYDAGVLSGDRRWINKYVFVVCKTDILPCTAVLAVFSDWTELCVDRLSGGGNNIRCDLSFTVLQNIEKLGNSPKKVN